MSGALGRLAGMFSALLSLFLLGLVVPTVVKAQPGNNDPPGLSVPLNTDWNQSTAGADTYSLEPLTPDGLGLCAGTTQMNQTVWYLITGNGGPIKLTTGSSFDSHLAVYQTAATPTTTQPLVGCDNDSAGNRDAQLEFTSTNGAAYLVQIGGCLTATANPCTLAGTSGDLSFGVLANDGRAYPEEVAVGQVTRTNRGATVESGETTSCAGAQYARTVWFRFRAPAPGRATFSATGGNLTVAVYQGSSTTPIGCNAGGVPGTVGSRLSLDLQGGEYLVQVGSLGSQGSATQGGFTYQVEFGEDLDIDNDGTDRNADCNDLNASIRPGASEIVNNDVDENCDRVLEFDRDGDGFRVPGSDCDDSNGAIHPGAPPIPGNGLDDDCNRAPESYPSVTAEATLSFRDTRRGIKVRSLVLRNVTRGARVEVRCKRKRKRACRRVVRRALASDVKARAARTIKVRQLRRKRLRARTLVEIRITKAGHRGKYIRYRVRRAGFKKRERCLNPGSRRPRRKCTTAAL